MHNFSWTTQLDTYIRKHGLPLTYLLGLTFIGLPGCSNHAPITSNHIRQQAIQESALSYGAQSALSWQAKRINHTVGVYERQLDDVFNFNALMLPNYLAPPVLQESRSNLNLADSDTIRLSDRTIEIVAPAHFVTVTPRWQDYIQLNYAEPSRPDHSMLPATALERMTWDEYVKIGWGRGIDQANMIFSDSLGKLTRDIQGMALYKSLLAENMVSPPYVAKSKLGITGDTHKMSLNDQVMRITAHSTLLPKQSEEWDPALAETPRSNALSNQHKQIQPNQNIKHTNNQTDVDEKLSHRQ